MWYVQNQNELYHHGILGMKWGVRRYQNKDGTLTEAGRKRYDRDIRENKAKKKDNRIQIDGPDPNRWVKEDLSRRQRIVDSAGKIVQDAKSIERKTGTQQKKQTLDLSHMTDQELRRDINRRFLEKQYNELFAEPEKVSKGREYARNILESAGTVLGVAGSALGLALAIKELKG